MSQWLKIEIYDNRVEIVNTGLLLAPTERFIDAEQARNKFLIELMRRCGLREERGKGIDETIVAIERRQLPAPIFGEAPSATQVAFFKTQKPRDMEKSGSSARLPSARLPAFLSGFAYDQFFVARAPWRHAAGRE